MEDANLIRLFDFYLAFLFLIGLYRRRRVYWDAVRLGVSIVDRRKKLLSVVANEKRELLTLETLRPIFVAIALMIIQWLCSRLIWPQADVPLGTLRAHWWKMAAVVAAFVPMFTVDLYFLITSGNSITAKPKSTSTKPSAGSAPGSRPPCGRSRSAW